MPKRRYTSDEQAAADVANALMDLPEHFIACRDLRHAWSIEEDFYVAETTRNNRIQEVRRELACLRCGAVRVEVYAPTRFGGLEKTKQSYAYAEGYQLKHVPRGVKPADILHAEQYRRAIERLTRQKRQKRSA